MRIPHDSLSAILTLSLTFPNLIICTNYYYGMYRSYGTGDTIITTYHAAGGSQDANRKWQVECFDGEAAVGVSDTMWDFAANSYVWCKFMFPYKPPSQGLYPYYRDCHVQDYTSNFFCYNKANHSATVNGMVTGFWDVEFVFWTFGPTDVLIYKCCRVPKGYYIDYLSCYYLPTHDSFWEYYDGNYFLVNCATGYVMTGIGSKISPINHEKRVDWVQCCRVGFGAVVGVSPPIINVKGRPPSYTTSHNVSPVNIPPEYSHQYRKKRSIGEKLRTTSNVTFGEDLKQEDQSFKRFWIPGSHVNDYDVPFHTHPNAHESNWLMQASSF